MVNNSHGDATMAARDADFKLIAVVQHRGEKYRLDETSLGDYLVPKKAIEVSDEEIETKQKGIAYAKTAWAYIFQKVR